MKIDIQINAPQALPTITGVENALGKVEDKAADVGDALSKGLGGGSPAADKTKQSTEGLAEQMTKLANAGKAFTGLDQVFKREADMLEKIHGPAKNYAADLQALDMLMEKGSISTEQYAQQLIRMNQAIEANALKTTEAKTPAEKLQGALELMAAPAIGVGIMEIGHKIEDLAETARKLEDEYTELANKALKFVDALHDQNQILAEQQQLAGKLHETIDPTIELYDAVRDGSDNLRISHEEQIRLTQSLAESMALANKPLSEAGGLMARFSYAMATGAMSGGEFKRMAKDVPDLADLWTKHWGVSLSTLQNLVEMGKVGPRDLMNVLITDFGEVDKNFAKRKATIEQQTKEFFENVNIARQQGMTSFDAIQLQGMDPKSFGAYKLKYGNDAQARMFGDQGQAEIDKMLSKAADIQNLTGDWRAMGEAQDKAAQAGMTAFIELPGRIGDIKKEVLDLGRQVGFLADQWDTGMTSFGRSTKLVMDSAAKIGEAKQQLAALPAAIKAGLGGEEARRQYEQLMTTINDGRLPAAIKEWNAIHDPIRTFKEDLSGLNGLLDKGQISWELYYQQLRKVEAENPDEVFQLGNKLNSQLEEQSHGIALVSQAYGQGLITLTQYTNELERLYSLVPPESVVDMLRGGPSLGQAASVSNVPTPAKPLTPYQADVVNQYEQRQAQSLTNDFHKQLTAYEESAKETNQRIAETFKPVVDGLINMFETGQLNISEIGSQMEKILTELAVKFLLFEALTSAGASAGVVKVITGFANGGDTTIPHAANGFAGRVGGVGGTDSKLAVMWVTPGEQVSVRTPEQVAAQQRAAGPGGNVMIVNKTDARGELAAGLSSGDHDTAIVNVIRRNKGAVQALLRK